MFLDNKKDVKKWLDDYNIKYYTITKDLVVNVKGNVDLRKLNLKSIPVKFGRVEGYFDIAENYLEVLDGCPFEVTGDFYCYENKLISLKGAPLEVLSFDCSHNLLTSLEGSPKIVKEMFRCSNNKLTSLKNSPSEVGTTYSCSNNNLESLEGLPLGEYRLEARNNNLKNLIGCPKVMKYINVKGNQITGLLGAPEIINGDMYLFKNNIKSLKYLPKKVYGVIDLRNNPLEEIKLEDIPAHLEEIEITLNDLKVKSILEYFGYESLDKESENNKIISLDILEKIIKSDIIKGVLEKELPQIKSTNKRLKV